MERLSPGGSQVLGGKGQMYCAIYRHNGKYRPYLEEFGGEKEPGRVLFGKKDRGLKGQLRGGTVLGVDWNRHQTLAASTQGSQGKTVGQIRILKHHSDVLQELKVGWN